MSLESGLVDRSRKRKARCFQPPRPVRRWPFPVSAELLNVFVHEAAGLDPCFWNKPRVVEPVEVEHHVAHGVSRGGSRPIFQRARIRV